jgi:hypothetical protein
MFKPKQVSLFISIFLLGSGVGFCFAQGEAQRPAQIADPKEIERAIEKAIKSVNDDKAREEKELIANLEGKLQEASQEWISQAREEKESEKNKFINQSWEMLPKYGPRVHYNYYLKGYDYQAGESDIMKTDSLLVPYKGYLKVTEIIYAQREHPAAASDKTQFLYIATTPIKINFDYKKDKFILKQGWPLEVQNRLKVD